MAEQTSTPVYPVERPSFSKSKQGGKSSIGNRTKKHVRKQTHSASHPSINSKSVPSTIPASTIPTNSCHTNSRLLSEFNLTPKSDLINANTIEDTDTTTPNNNNDNNNRILHNLNEESTRNGEHLSSAHLSYKHTNSYNININNIEYNDGYKSPHSSSSGDYISSTDSNNPNNNNNNNNSRSRSYSSTNVLILKSPGPNAGKPPSMVLVHLAVIIAQLSFGSASVIGVLGLPSMNPILFTLIRDSVSGPCLCIIAYCIDKQFPNFLKHFWRFGQTGFCLFMQQLFYIIGLKLTNSYVIANAWQPSQAIFGIIYGYFCFKVEKHLDKYKIIGIMVAIAGALFITLYDYDLKKYSSGKHFVTFFVGNIFFFINCSAIVFYLILSRKLLKYYPSSTVVGYSYVIAASLMCFAALIVSSSDRYSVISP